MSLLKRKTPRLYIPSIPPSVAEGDTIVYDTEFMESGGFKPVEFVSIGLKRKSDGATYYGISTQFNPKHANAWVRKNVLVHLPPRDKLRGDPTQIGWGERQRAYQWKERGQIAVDLVAFCGKKPKIWAWYGAYDHVVISQLFGAMIQLPEGWPMWNRDIKMLTWLLGDVQLPRVEQDRPHHALADAERAYDQLMLLGKMWEEKYGTSIF